ncbi:MAG: type II secretion system F family protein [Acidimicrobiia bacterium]
MIALIVVLAVAAVSCGAWAASTTLESRSGTRRSLRAMDDYQVADVREQEMLESIGARVLAPLSRGLVDLTRRVTPVGYSENVKRKIVLAGNPPGYEVDRFMILKVLGFASGLVWIGLAVTFFSSNRLFAILLVLFAWGVCFFGPDVILDGRIARRRDEIERRLPDTLDLLVISVEAGLGFEQALERTAAAVPGPLSEESRRMLQETRMGASRADALRALDERTQVDDLGTFILAMLQADAFGVSISRILRSQADEIRIRRRQAAQEKSQKAPIKMLFPLAVCIFPAVFVIVLLPAVLQIFKVF